MEERTSEISDHRVKIYLEKDKNYITLKRERELKRPKRFISEVDSLFVVGEYPQGSRTKHIVEVSSKNKFFAEFDEKEDTVKSGESLFKVYSFEPKKNNPNLEKCVAFWNSITDMNLEPVDCSLKIPKEPTVEEKDKQEQTKTDQEECKCSSPWLTILTEMRKRNLDKVALVTTGHKCEFCRHDCTTIEPNYTISDDVLSLNTWVPKSNWVDPRIIRKQKEEQKKLERKMKEELQKTDDKQKEKEEYNEDEDFESKKYSAASNVPSNLYFRSDEKIFASKHSFQSIQIPFEALEEVCACGILECDCKFNSSLLEDSRSKLSLIVEEPEENVHHQEEEEDVHHREEERHDHHQEEENVHVEEIKAEKHKEQTKHYRKTQNKQIQVPTPELDETTPKESTLCLLCGEKNCRCKQDKKKTQVTSQDSTLHIIQTLEEQSKKIIEYILFGQTEETSTFDVPKEYVQKTNLRQITEKVFDKHQNLFKEFADEINYDVLETCVKDIVIEVFKSEEVSDESDNISSQKSSVKFNNEKLESIKEVSPILQARSSEAQEKDTTKVESAPKTLVYVPKLPKKKVKEYKDPGRKL